MQRAHSLNTFAVKASLHGDHLEALRLLNSASDIISKVIFSTPWNGVVVPPPDAECPLLNSVPLLNANDATEHQTSSGCFLFFSHLFFDPVADTKMTMVELLSVIFYNTGAIHHQLYLETGLSMHLDFAEMSYTSSIRVVQKGPLRVETISRLILANMNNLALAKDLRYNSKAVKQYAKQMHLCYNATNHLLSSCDAEFFGFSVTIYNLLSNNCAGQA